MYKPVSFKMRVDTFWEVIEKEKENKGLLRTEPCQ